MEPRIAIKYCGGCNPRHQRCELADRLRRDFPGVALVRPGDRGDSPPDLVVVICGCASACASHQHLEGRYGKVCATSAGDYEDIRRAVASMMERSGSAPE